MADIIATLIKELRERTGAGIMECKKALVETKGDIELAIDNIRKSSKIKAAKKANQLALQGIILIKIAKERKYGVIMELNCETDFVAKNEEFKCFGNKVITTALNERITDIEELKTKFECQRALLITKIGENINIRRISVIKGDMLNYYLHGTRIGVIVSTNSVDENLMKHVAMHIAASKPEYVNSKDIPADVFDREYKIQQDIVIKSGKTREVAEKILEGRMRKFTNEISLTGQNFVINPSKTVGQVLNEYGYKINNFIRFEVGEGINKKL